MKPTLNPALQKLIADMASKYSRNKDDVDYDDTDYAALDDEKIIDSALAREARKLFRRANRLELQVEALRRAGNLLTG